VIALQIDHFNQVPVARLPTDVDAANASALAERLAASVGQQARDLVVDLTHTRYIDSAGIDMLFRLHQRLGQRRASLCLVIMPNSPLARLADIVALPTVIPVHADVGDAVEALTRGRPGEAES
jgi:anti-anti-sigma factor